MLELLRIEARKPRGTRADIWHAPNDIKHVVLQFSSALVWSIPMTPALLAAVGVQCSSGTLLSALGRIMASLTLGRAPIRVSPTHQHIEIRVGPRNVQAPARNSAAVAVLVGRRKHRFLTKDRENEIIAAPHGIPHLSPFGQWRRDPSGAVSS